MKTTKVKNRNCPLCGNHSARKLNVVNSIDVVRCSECKMVFADVDNSEIEEKNIYTDETFYKYLQNEPVYSLAYYDLILEKIKKKYGEKVKILELGSGPGLFLQRAKYKGINAQGCDISAYSEFAKEKFGLNIKIGNILNSDYKNEEFDVVISHATHEHLSEMYQITDKLNKLLKVGGLFIISGVPNYNTIQIKIFRDFFRNKPPSHVNFFEKKTLKKLYSELNIKSISVKTYGVSTWVWHFMQKIKSNKMKKSDVVNNDVKQQYKQPTITKKHKFIAKLYKIAHLPLMGRNIEIWGEKEK